MNKSVFNPVKLDASHFKRSERVAGAIGLAAVLPGAFLAWRFPGALAPAWRCAVFIWVGPAIGSLVFGLIQQMTGGVWAQDLRVFLLTGIRLLPWTWLSVLPLLGVGLREPIAGPGFGYATPAAFTLRAVLYGVVFFALSLAMRRAWPKEGRSEKLRWVGPMGAIVLLFMTHLLASDWLASLDLHWHSTAFPVVWLSGQAVAGLAVAILCAILAGANPAQSIGYHRFLGVDWGSLLFATAMFWCYVAFSQFLIVWSGNLPEEAIWYTRRMAGLWRYVPLALVVLHFLAPLVVLLSRQAKQKRRPLAIVAILLVAGQSLHTAWMILGAFPDAPVATPLLALVFVLSIGGVFRQPLSRPRPQGNQRMSETRENSGYETTDARVSHVVAGAAILFGGILFSLAVAALVYRGETSFPDRRAAEMSFTHGSENEFSLVRDWREQDERVHDHLENYTWVDRERGLVSIPIERAMALMARDAANPKQEAP